MKEYDIVYKAKSESSVKAKNPEEAKRKVRNMSMGDLLEEIIIVEVYEEGELIEEESFTGVLRKVEQGGKYGGTIGDDNNEQ